MTWKFDITNIGGILEAKAQIEPGLNAVTASNWQGKSSFIAAIESSLGVSKTLMERADSGSVAYRGPHKDGVVELTRTNGTVQSQGEPILPTEYDRVRTRLFACLGETNELRQAVRNGTNLESLLLRPLDFENIDQQIRAHKREREQVDAEIEQAQQAKRQLSTAESKVGELEAKLQSLRQKRRSLSSGDKSDAESTRDELTKVEAERDRIEQKITRFAESIKRTEESLSSKRAELANLDEITVEDVEAELQEAQTQLRSLKKDTKVVESLYSANELVLQENRLKLVTEIRHELDGDRAVCWCCGNETLTNDIESQLETLHEKLSTVKSKTARCRERVEKLEATREKATQHRRQQQHLEADIEQLVEKLAVDRRSIETARERLKELTGRINTLSKQVDESIDRLTDIESKIKYREAELESETDDCKNLRKRAERLDGLKAQRREIADELARLRDRKASIKRETRQAFDEAVQTIVDRFETGFETARLTDNFELIVAREGRQAALDALSEGEIELLGFVAAMAGYRAFDVADTAPFILVDRVGGLSEANLHELVEYLKERTTYMVFTTYPEHSAESHSIDPTTWRVTSRD